MLGFWKTRRGLATGTAVAIACILAAVFGVSERLRPGLVWPRLQGTPQAPSAEIKPAQVAESVPAVVAPLKPGAAVPSGTAPAPTGDQQADAAHPGPDGTTPSFDVVRVEPNGDSVIAARGAPNTEVVLLDGKTPIARAKSDTSGQVAFVPPALTPGSHSLTLSTTMPNSGDAASSQNVIVSVPAHGTAAPLVALFKPNQPASIVSGPVAGSKGTTESGLGNADAGGPGGGRSGAGDTNTADAGSGDAGGQSASAVSDSARGTATPSGRAAGSPALPGSTPTAIRSVEIEDMGSFYATGKATPGRPCRVYLNGSFVATVTPDGNGIWSLQIKRGMKPGRYAVRVDEVEAGSDKVISRAEVPFDYPRSTGVSLRKGHGSRRTTIAGSPDGAAVSPDPADVPNGAGFSATTTSTSAAAPSVRGSDARSVPDPTRTASGENATALQAGPRGAGSVTASPSSIIADLVTAKVSWGDSLWRISRKMLGHGIRYTQIYAANTAQIRDPKLIYPGQVFVMPQTGRP